MLRRSIMVGLAGGIMTMAHSSQAEFTGRTTQWNGYARHDFTHDGRGCIVVEPHKEAEGRPWIWRARFFGHEPQTDLALLERGYHLVYMDVAAMFGAPKAVAHWNALYALLTTEHGFAPKVVLEGMSRGGLIIYNWAKANPDKVACVYADAPVCDIRSWPGGKGRGKGDAASWAQCLREYGITEADAETFTGNPVDGLEPLAKAGVPLLHVCGEADGVVPIEENTGILAERYRKLGGNVTVIAKPHCDHHPHSLKNPARIVNFILDNTPGMATSARIPAETPYGYDYFELRNGLPNCRAVFAGKKQARVVFLGGSITRMAGWSELVCDDLKRRFPDTTFDFVNAGIPSTGSTPGAFRLVRDVFGKGPVDLLFEEAAVNDTTNRPDHPEEWLRGMEGIVRHARLLNPAIDIVLLYFADPDKVQAYNDGRLPPVIGVHESVAKHYGLPSIDLAREVTERIHAGEFTWKDDFRNLHPAPFGHRLYAATIGRLFDAAWADPTKLRTEPAAYVMPPRPLDPACYDHGTLAGLDRATRITGWTLNPSWRPTRGGTRPGFVDVPMLTAETPGATLTFPFQGTAAGIFVAAGYDAGIIEYAVDNGPPQTRDLFTQWSKGLHIPWAHVLAAALPPGDHTLTIRIADTKNPGSEGHACRIVNFLENGDGVSAK